MPRVDPVILHGYSARLYRGRFRSLARALDLVSVLFFQARIPPQVKIGPGLRLGHRGLGVVIHPNTSIGRNVTIMHQVTLGADLPLTDSRRIFLEDGVMVGAGAIIVGPLTIGRGASIGAGSVITEDVAAGATMVGNPARPVTHD